MLLTQTVNPSVWHEVCYSYDLTTNGTEWIPVSGTINDLSPTEDSFTQELSNITVLNSPKDVPRIDQFGDCWPECTSEAPAKAFYALCDEEEVMEQGFPEGGREDSKAQRSQTPIKGVHSTAPQGTPALIASASKRKKATIVRKSSLMSPLLNLPKSSLLSLLKSILMSPLMSSVMTLLLSLLID